MSEEKRASRPAKAQGQSKAHQSPEWASGLKQLYDSVVEEPIPDAFKDLLAQFDSDKK